MKFLVVGTNHNHSPIEFREKLSFSKKRTKQILTYLDQKTQIISSVILLTCNRIEIYAAVKNYTEELNNIMNFLKEYFELKDGEISDYLYKYKHREVIEHLYKVSSGIDSLILGETQILGQVKKALKISKQAGLVNNFLENIFYQSTQFAGTIHQKTNISEGKVSVGSLTLDFIKHRFKTLKDKNILIIGVGKVTKLVLKYLQSEEPKVVFISNRTYKKAKKLAKKIDGEAVNFNSFNKYLKKADIVITGTASPHFIIKKERLNEIDFNNLFIIDLAVPRDVDPKVKRINGVNLFSLEKLDKVIENNLKKREKEALKAKKLIRKEISKKWKRCIELEPEKVN